MSHRAGRARINAGLSLEQAAKMLPWGRDRLAAIERGDVLDIDHAVALADVYHVDVRWICGLTPERDYATVDKMNGADKLTFHDRDVIAEFAASLPRSKT